MSGDCDLKTKRDSLIDSAQRIQQRPYHKPTVYRFGSVADLTAGISGGIGESEDPQAKKQGGLP